MGRFGSSSLLTDAFATDTQIGFGIDPDAWQHRAVQCEFASHGKVAIVHSPEQHCAGSATNPEMSTERGTRRFGHGIVAGSKQSSDAWQQIPPLHVASNVFDRQHSALVVHGAPKGKAQHLRRFGKQHAPSQQVASDWRLRALILFSNCRRPAVALYGLQGSPTKAHDVGEMVVGKLVGNTVGSFVGD